MRICGLRRDKTQNLGESIQTRESSHPSQVKPSQFSWTHNFSDPRLSRIRFSFVCRFPFQGPNLQPRPEHPGCGRATNANAALNEYDVSPRRRRLNLGRGYVTTSHAQTPAWAGPMRQLMQVGRNLRVGLVVRESVCEGGSRPQGWTDMAPCCCSRLSPQLGGDPAEGGEVRDVAVSLAVEMVCYRVGDLSQIAPTCSMRVRHFPRLPQTHACKLEATAARQARASQLPCPAQGGGVPPWLSHVCGRVSATLISPQLSPSHLPTPTVRSWGTLLPVLRPRRYPYCTTLLLSSSPPLLVLPPPPRSRRQR